jgi:phage-related protein (TIGR01555 family)
MFDNFKNLVANLGTERDKQTSGYYALSQITDQQWSLIYRTSWMGRKVVDIPAQDATRKWREWQAEKPQIMAIAGLEKQHKLQQKTKLAMQQARLYGGSGIYYSIKNDDPALPLDFSAIKKDSLEFITVLSKDILVAGELELDPLEPGYGKPKHYEIHGQTSGLQKIHPSRLAIFIGNEILTPDEITGRSQGWGDSVLQSAYEAVRTADSTQSNIASLVYEAKVDVLQIPELANIMANPRHRQMLEERVVLSGQLKGNNGMLVIDGEEKYEQKTFTFSGLPEISYQTLQAVSGAADIPLTRFLGESPGGLNNNGDSDLKNYYDAVNSVQSLEITPALANLDECLIRSALGNRPEEIYFIWSSLWQMSDDKKSQISKETAETIKILVESALFNEADLAVAAGNLLVEHSILPSFKVDETREPEEDEDL